MLPMWRLMDALLGGTETMRNAGKEYLTQHTGEVDSRYLERQMQATLWNQLEITLGGWVGRPFRDPLKLNDDVPEEITKLSDDIDQLGTNVDTFARAWFKSGVSKAFCHVLIEQPQVQEREDGENLSIKEASQQGIRPYWSLIEADEIIAARSAVIEGQEVYTHVRIHERTLVQDPEDQFNEIWEERIRVYDRYVDSVTVTVYKRDEEKDSDSADGWPQEGQPIELGIKEIPLVTFYADRQGFLLGKSPLQDLAELNKKHWNSQSDQDNILTIARFPILAASGVASIDGSDALSGDPQAGSDFNGKKGVVIGPWNVLVSEEIGSKFYYVEHSGKAIKTGQDSLELLEAKMAAYGSEFLKKSPDRQTATARAMDSQESVSPLQAITLNFIDAMQTALALTAKWMNITSDDQEDGKFHGGTVTIVTDFGPEGTNDTDVNALLESHKLRILSGPQVRKELRRRGILADEFDEKVNQKELDTELLRLPEAGKDLDPLLTVSDALAGDHGVPPEKPEKKNESKKDDEDDKDDDTAE